MLRTNNKFITNDLKKFITIYLNNSNRNKFYNKSSQILLLFIITFVTIYNVLSMIQFCRDTFVTNPNIFGTVHLQAFLELWSQIKH